MTETAHRKGLITFTPKRVLEFALVGAAGAGLMLALQGGGHNPNIVPAQGDVPGSGDAEPSDDPLASAGLIANFPPSAFPSGSLAPEVKPSAASQSPTTPSSETGQIPDGFKSFTSTIGNYTADIPEGWENANPNQNLDTFTPSQNNPQHLYSGVIKWEPLTTSVDDVVSQIVSDYPSNNETQLQPPREITNRFGVVFKTIASQNANGSQDYEAITTYGGNIYMINYYIVPGEINDSGTNDFSKIVDSFKFNN